jgi:hypothetical protein
MARAGLLITPGINTRSSATATIFFALVNVLSSFRGPPTHVERGFDSAEHCFQALREWGPPASYHARKHMKEA